VEPDAAPPPPIDGKTSCLYLRHQLDFVLATPPQTCLFSTQGWDVVLTDNGAPELVPPSCGDGCNIVHTSEANGDGFWKADAVMWVDPMYLGEAIRVQPELGDDCVWIRCGIVLPQ